MSACACQNNQAIIIEPVISETQQAIVVSLARQIWNQHFVAIIGQAQVDYMLDKFQSSSAISSQIRQGFSYYLASYDKGDGKHEGQHQGYMALYKAPDATGLMISKLYVLQQARGQGIGSCLLSQAYQLAAGNAEERLWLTVNRFNDDSIAWYRRRGFNVTEKVKKPIGNGFYMDDFIMTKLLLPQA